MTVGVAFAGAIMKDSGITATAAMALAIGIAIQNFPEGAIISMPLRGEGMSKKKAFVCGVLSGIVEPVGGFITILIAGVIAPVLPMLLCLPLCDSGMSSSITTYIIAPAANESR